MILCPNTERNVAYMGMMKLVVGQYILNYQNRNTKWNQKKEKMVRIIATQRKVQTSGKIVGNNQNKLEWMKMRKNKYRKDRYGHIKGDIDSRDENSIDALREDGEINEGKKEQEKQKGNAQNPKESTKYWVTKRFYRKNSLSKDTYDIANNRKEENQKKEDHEEKDEKQMTEPKKEGQEQKIGELALLEVNNEEHFPQQ